MKALPLLVALVGCGGTKPVDLGDAADDAPIGVSLDAAGDAAHVDAGSDATADAPTTTDAGVDAITDAGIDAAALAACITTACSNAQAQCGPISATCFGQPVDCGACTLPAMCGDNNTANRCGITCLNQYAWVCQSCSNCNFGFQPTWGVTLGCSQPYEISDGGYVLRDGGIAGCVGHQMSSNLWVTCCP